MLINKEALFLTISSKDHLLVCFNDVNNMDYLMINGEKTRLDWIKYTAVWNDKSTWVPLEIKKGSSLEVHFSNGDSHEEIESVSVVGGTVEYNSIKGIAIWDGSSKYFGINVIDFDAAE